MGYNLHMDKELADTVFDGLMSGKLKPPKLRATGELEALSKKQESIEEALRRDFGLKSKKSKPKRTGTMKRQAH